MRVSGWSGPSFDSRRRSVSNGYAPARNSRRRYASRLNALFSVPLPSHHAGPCERLTGGRDRRDPHRLGGYAGQCPPAQGQERVEAAPGGKYDDPKNDPKKAQIVVDPGGDRPDVKVLAVTGLSQFSTASLTLEPYQVAWLKPVG